VSSVITPISAGLSIAKYELDTDATSLSFSFDPSEIPFFLAAYEILWAAGAPNNINFTVNNNTGANYQSQVITGSGATAVGAQALSAANWGMGTLTSAKPTTVGLILLYPLAGTLGRPTGLNLRGDRFGDSAQRVLLYSLDWSGGGGITSFQINGSQADGLKEGTNLRVLVPTI
jgi:hypothetical protein